MAAYEKFRMITAKMKINVPPRRCPSRNTNPQKLAFLARLFHHGARRTPEQQF